MGTAYINTYFHNLWSTERPTIGYSRTVTELIYHIYTLKNITVFPYVIELDEAGWYHYFLRNTGGEVIDLCVEDMNFELPYDSAKPADSLINRKSMGAFQLLKMMNALKGGILRDGVDEFYN
jgi:hypothetical protein